MKLTARVLLFGAVLAAGCSGGPSMKRAEPDAAGGAHPSDAARDRDVARGTVGPPMTDGPRSEAHDAAADGPRDAGRDAGRDAVIDAEIGVPTHACSAGHTCSGTARCERACIGQLIYRCSCADGRFVCTGCISVDGGAPDLRGGPALCAADVAEGRRCDPAGAVCQQRGDGSQKLCACGDLGADNVWICQ
jgi:hypothetical protein